MLVPVYFPDEKPKETIHIIGMVPIYNTEMKIHIYSTYAFWKMSKDNLSI